VLALTGLDSLQALECNAPSAMAQAGSHDCHILNTAVDTSTVGFVENEVTAIIVDWIGPEFPTVAAWVLHLWTGHIRLHACVQDQGSDSFKVLEPSMRPHTIRTAVTAVLNVTQNPRQDAAWCATVCDHADNQPGDMKAGEWMRDLDICRVWMVGLSIANATTITSVSLLPSRTTILGVPSSGLVFRW
jgi:hypothetical protein